jgi:hypothetical protein
MVYLSRQQKQIFSLVLDKIPVEYNIVEHKSDRIALLERDGKYYYLKLFTEKDTVIGIDYIINLSKRMADE